MKNKIFIVELIFLSLVFNEIPRNLQMNFLGGPVQSKLVFYPLFIGFIYTIYCQYKYKDVLVNFDKFIKFILVYLAITFISLIIGLYNYPYYDLVLNRPVMYFGSSYFIIYMLFLFLFYGGKWQNQMELFVLH